MFSVCRGRKVRVVCRQRSTEGKRIRKEEEELEEDSTTSQSVIRKRRSPPKQICLIFPEERHAKRHRRTTDGADKREGGEDAPNKRQTRSSSDAAGRTRTRARRPVRAERDSVSLSRAGREEDSAAQVKSGAGSVLSVASQCRACCRFCQEKGRTVSRKNRATHLPSLYFCPTPVSLPPHPSSHTHFRRQERIGGLCGARDAALKGGAGGGEFKLWTTLLPSSLPRTSLKTNQEGRNRARKEAAETCRGVFM